MIYILDWQDKFPHDQIWSRPDEIEISRNEIILLFY